MICMIVMIFGVTVRSIAFNAAETTRSKPKPIVAPYENIIAFFAPAFFTVDKIKIFVGPGVNVAIKQ
ncbi:hypothetical protein D3C84_1267450 [compost metagenome]